MSDLSCWVVTDGRAGMENQCLGLAEALGLLPVVKRIKLRSPWKQLSPYLRCGLSYAVSNEGDPITPPWPDILIASGRASVPASLYVRRASKVGEKGGTFTVQIQNPVINPSFFDLVVVPRHDRLEGTNVMATLGSMHRISLEKLAVEASKFLPQVASLPSPRIGVSIGGSNAVYSFSSEEMQNVAMQLKALVMREGSLMVTISRRTGAENLAILKKTLHGTQSYIWDGQGENPYFGILGLAEAMLVTCDSVNMISEACSTGKPVMIIDLPGGSEKFRFFHQLMRDAGMTRPFRGRIERWQHAPLDDVRLVAERIKAMLEQRLS
ncbi:MAG: mitochondrial fission ELM1 family protein [Bdellovibrionales bacterium]